MQPRVGMGLPSAQVIYIVLPSEVGSPHRLRGVGAKVYSKLVTYAHETGW